MVAELAEISEHNVIAISRIYSKRQRRLSESWAGNINQVNDTLSQPLPDDDAFAAYVPGQKTLWRQHRSKKYGNNSPSHRLLFSITSSFGP